MIVRLKKILNGLYAIEPNEEEMFLLTKQEYQFMNNLD